MIAGSLRDFGAGRSVVTDRTGNLIAGNKTVEAALGLGMTEMIVVPSDGTKLVVHQRMDLDIADPAAKKLALADNRAGEVSLDWDAAVIQDMMPEMDLAPLWTDKEMGRLLSDLTSTSSATDEAPDRPEKPTTKRGDRITLGSHVLVCGNAFSPETVEHLLEGAEVHMVWTDPVDDTKRERNRLDLAERLNEQLVAIADVMARGAVCYLAHPDAVSLEYREAMIAAGIAVRQCLIWVKNTPDGGKADYHAKHEPVLYGWKGGGAHGWYSNRRQSTVLRYDRPMRSEHYRSMKPVAMVEYHIRNSTAPRQIVYDPYGGTGTTLMACEAAGRSCRMLEIEPAMCDVIIQRWEATTGKKAVLEVHDEVL
jgi:DNA modification methylase